ncbi:hypothetical protein MHU86_13339 [Fragilaria crotonensis]|nr:hypothetical protein MHU86_13339 [Fragilaria crotonensis]
MIRSLWLLLFLLLSIFSSQASQFPPRGGAWFGRRGGNGGKKVVEPTTVDKKHSKASKTRSTDVKGSSSPSNSKKQRKIKKKVRKHRKGSSTLPGVGSKTGNVNVENEQDRRKIRSEEPHQRKRVKGESTKRNDKSKGSTQPVRKRVRKIKKKTKHRTLARRDDETAFEIQSMSVQNVDEVVTQRPLSKNHRKKVKKRAIPKNAVESFHYDKDAAPGPHREVTQDRTLRHTKRTKKRKRRTGTAVKASIPVTVTSVEPDLPLKKHKKRRKRHTSNVKGASENTLPVDAGVENVREDSLKLKKKRKKVKKKPTLLEVPPVEGGLARATFEKPLGDQLIDTIPLPISSEPANDAAADSFEPNQHELESGVSQKIEFISNNPNDEIGARVDVAARDQSELTAMEANIPFFGHGAEKDQTEQEDIDEPDSAPREEAEEHDGHGLLGKIAEFTPVFQDRQNETGQVNPKREDLLETESLAPENQGANNELETEDKTVPDVSHEPELEPEGHTDADADTATDNDALDELVEALIEGRLDESGANDNDSSKAFREGVEDALKEESVETTSATSLIEELEENDLLPSDTKPPSDTIVGEEKPIEGAMSYIGGKETNGYEGSSTIEEDIARVESALYEGSLLESPSDAILEAEEQENADSGEQLALQEDLSSESPSDTTIAMEEPGSGDDGEDADDQVAFGERVDEDMEGDVFQGEHPGTTDGDFQSGSPITADTDLVGDSIRSNNDEVDDDVQTAVSVDVVVDASDVESDPELMDDPLGENRAGVPHDAEEVSENHEIIEPGILASEKILLPGKIDDRAESSDKERAEKGIEAGDEREQDGLGNQEIDSPRQEEMEKAETTSKNEDLEEDLASVGSDAQPTDEEPTCVNNEPNENCKLNNGEAGHQVDPDGELGLSAERDSAPSNEEETEGTFTSEESSHLPFNVEMNVTAKVSVVPSVDNSDNQISALQPQFVKTDVQSIAESEDDPSDITVSIVSWNLAEQVVPENDAAFIRKFRSTPRCHKDGEDGSDIVLISSQECENIKPRRSEGHRSRELRRLMIKMLGKNYVPLAIHSLGGIQFGLFCKRSILSDIEFVSIADVTCGIGNVFHNKGAIGAFLQMKSRNSSRSKSGDVKIRTAKSVKMLFVTAHLAAHVKNVDSRNMDYWRIASELQAQAPARFLPTKPNTARDDESTGTGSHLIDSVDRIFFCGDLNYRVDLPREITEHSILTIKRLMKLGDAESLKKAEELRSGLLLHDQLRQVLAQGAAFPGFAEGRITFMPTFKFDMDTDDYDSSHKQRIPAWTDRVLFKPFGTRVIEYTSEEHARHSDHRPVHATFRVSTVGRDIATLPKRGSTKKRSRRSTGSKQNVPHDGN